MPEMYAVVAADTGGCEHRFTKWHDSFEKAKQEAKRLAKDNNEKFYVLKVLGYAEVKSVEWVEL